MKKSCLAIFSAVIALSSAHGQNASSNLTTFTPSALLSKGQYEIQSFNNLYTQNSVRDAAGDEVNLNQRQIFLTSISNHHKIPQSC